MNLPTVAVSIAVGLPLAAVAGIVVTRHVERRVQQRNADLARVAGERAVIDAFHADPAVIEALRIAGGHR